MTAAGVMDGVVGVERESNLLAKNNGFLLN